MTRLKSFIFGRKLRKLLYHLIWRSTELHLGFCGCIALHFMIFVLVLAGSRLQLIIQFGFVRMLSKLEEEKKKSRGRGREAHSSAEIIWVDYKGRPTWVWFRNLELWSGDEIFRLSTFSGIIHRSFVGTHDISDMHQVTLAYIADF